MKRVTSSMQTIYVSQPIILPLINTRTQLRPPSHNYNNQYTHQIKLQQDTFANYRKANWTQFTTYTEAAFSDIQPPINVHTANIIIHADKQNILKGKIHSTCKLLPYHRNNIRAPNSYDPLISELTRKSYPSYKQRNLSYGGNT